jgi:mannose-6-phosphate isomerase-like protein (cupin superfamily)
MNYSSLLKELLSFQRYENNEIVGIRNSLDIFIRDKMSYGEWVNSYKSFPTVKVEGIESINSVTRKFKKLHPKNIHLFVTQETGVSFKWHRDTVNVYLYVLKGSKIVHLRNRTVTLKTKQGIVIPRKHIHRVFSKAGTVALSVGY